MVAVLKSLRAHIDSSPCCERFSARFMSERQYTDKQKEVFKKINTVLKQNPTLHLLRLSGFGLAEYGVLNEHNDFSTKLEALRYAKKVFDDFQSRSDHSKIILSLKETLRKQIEVSKLLLSSRDISKDITAEQLNTLNAYCCKISILISYYTRKETLSQLVKDITFYLINVESQPNIVSAFIMYYVVGLDQDAIATQFNINRKTVKRWLMRCIIDDLSAEMQTIILTQYRD